MIEQFEQLEAAIGKLETLISELKKDKDQLLRDVSELKGIIDDRDLEILQLQEDIQKKDVAERSEKTAIESKIEGLLGRVSALASEGKPTETQF